ncbi:MAG: efflux RND transporter periplasmic adaptor subunit [Rhodanobacter sp.]
MSYYPWRTGALGVLVGALLFTLAAVAANNTFPVSAAQMHALGITVQRLNKPGAIRGLSYPAQVLLPPQQDVVISAPVAGVVDQLLVTEHQRLTVGQPLLRLASPEFGELQLAALEAASKNRLAQQTLQREKQLFAEGIVPQRRLFEAEAAASDGKAGLRQASAALRLAGLDAPTIARLIGSGALQETLTLKARSAGLVVDLQAKPGQRVAAADPLLRIADPSKLWLDIQIPAERADAWAKDGDITVVGRSVTARPMQAGAVVGEGQTVSLRAQITAGVDRVRPGEFVQVQVPFADRADAWSLPLAAVARQSEQAYVFVRTAQGFEARPVDVVASAGQSVSVQGPLKSADQVAVSSVIALKAAWLGESGGE